MSFLQTSEELSQDLKGQQWKTTERKLTVDIVSMGLQFIINPTDPINIF